MNFVYKLVYLVTETVMLTSSDLRQQTTITGVNTEKRVSLSLAGKQVLFDSLFMLLTLGARDYAVY